MTSSFSSGTAITKMRVFYDVFLAVISDQSSQTFPIYLYLLSSFPTVMLVKAYIDNNAVVNDIAFVIDGSSFFSVSDDKSLRNMTKSPYNSLFETS
jgi:hypothetical protein